MAKEHPLNPEALVLRTTLALKAYNSDRINVGLCAANAC